MFFKKLRDKKAAVSMVVILIISVIIAPVVAATSNTVSKGIKDKGDDVKASMPYQVLGSDYKKPERIETGYTEEEVNNYTVPKPTRSKSYATGTSIPFKTGLVLSFNPNVYQTVQGATLTVTAYLYNHVTKEKITVPVTPGLNIELPVDEPGVYTMFSSAKASMNFQINGQTATKYSEEEQHNHTITVESSAKFESYGFIVKPDKISRTSTVEATLIASKPIMRIEGAQAIVGNTLYQVPDIGKFIANDKATAFFSAESIYQMFPPPTEGGVQPLYYDVNLKFIVVSYQAEILSVPMILRIYTR